MKYEILREHQPSQCREGDVLIREEVDCEHCGKLEPYDAVIADGGTYWCVMCFGNMFEISQDVLEEISKIEKQLKKRYFTQRLIEIDEDDS